MLCSNFPKYFSAFCIYLGNRTLKIILHFVPNRTLKIILHSGLFPQYEDEDNDNVMLAPDGDHVTAMDHARSVR